MPHPSATRVRLLGIAVGCLAWGCTPDLGDDAQDALWNCPSILVTTTTLTWSHAPLDEPEVRTLNVENACDAGDDLQVEAQMSASTTDAQSRFTLETSQLTVAPGGAQGLQIWFSASDYQPVEADLTLQTNAYGDVEVDVALSGTADPDQDGDGHDAWQVGGDDCDDQDAEVSDDCD